MCVRVCVCALPFKRSSILLYPSPLLYPHNRPIDLLYCCVSVVIGVVAVAACLRSTGSMVVLFRSVARLCGAMCGSLPSQNWREELGYVRMIPKLFMLIALSNWSDRRNYLLLAF